MYNTAEWGFSTAVDIPAFFSYAVQDLLNGKSRNEVRSAEPQETTLASVGVGPGQAGGDLLCPRSGFGNEVAGGLWGTVNPAYFYHVPSRLSVLCKPGDRDTPNVASTYMAGTWDGNYSESSYAPDKVMIGAYGYSAEMVQSIGVICAPRTAVWNGQPVTGRDGEFFGLQEDLQWRRQCPVGMAVKGIRSSFAYWTGSRSSVSSCNRPSRYS